MTITTEEAERLAKAVECLVYQATALRSLAAERDALKANQDKAQGYLLRCLQSLYPNIEPLPDLLGVCTLIDIVLAGQKAETARLREAMKNLLSYAERNECHHENIHRGGIIWTICDDCGGKWADDQGGLKPYCEPVEITAARQALGDKENVA
jgi:hypothetical protein